MNEPIHVACVGDANDINVWSNTPYFFLQEGKSRFLFRSALYNNPSDFKRFKIIWNLQQVIKFKGYGGYQYTLDFLTRLEKSVDQSKLSETIISFNQLFPRATTVNTAGGTIYYYIDCTLHQLFNSESYAIKASAKVKEEALIIEKENYKKANKVVCMARHVKDDLISYYNLPEDHVEVVRPGANIVIEEYRGVKKADFDGTFTIGFIGKDWERKGLGLLIDAVKTLNNKGFNIQIETIGTNSPELKSYAFVKEHGFIDKQRDTKKFVQIIKEFDLGVLLSQSEALGISVLEFQVLGVPVLGFDHEGMKDTISEEYGFKIPLTDSSVSISQILEKIVLESERLKRYSAGLLQSRLSYTWSATLNKWEEILLNG